VRVYDLDKTVFLYSIASHRSSTELKQVIVIKQILHTDNAKTTIIIRLIVGVVFLSEGIQKFLFPGTRSAGRFEKIGLPSPEYLGTMVGTFEIICGTFILLGFVTRLACLPLITIMLIALLTTKAEILSDKGFWEMMHASRTDWSMLLGSIFLFINGGGCWSVDKKLMKGGR